MGGQRVGLLGEFEAGRIQQVLLKALLDVQVVREQNDRVGNEDQDRNEALAVAPQERRVGFWHLLDRAYLPVAMSRKYSGR